MKSNQKPIIKQLKHLNQIKQEFKVEETYSYSVHGDKGLRVLHENAKEWSYINPEMFSLFGKKIKVIPFYDSDNCFHYEEYKSDLTKHGWVFHQDWFLEPFFSNEDFKI